MPDDLLPEDAAELASLRAEVAQLRERVSHLERLAGSRALLASGNPAGRQWFGLKTINRTGAVTVAIGLIFFFKYAVDEHLIGAFAGVLLGVAFGALLIGAGVWLGRRGQPVFAQGIAGCGLAAVYISLYASFAFYELIPQSVGFLLLVLVCAGAIALSLRFASAAIAALGVSGALLTPWLLHSRSSESWLECLYLLMVAATALVMARRQGWPVLVVLAGALGLLASLALFPVRSWWFVAFGGGLAVSNGLAMFGVEIQSKTRACLYVMAQVAFLAAGFGVLGIEFGDRNVAYQAASVLLACWGIAELAYGLARNARLDVRVGLVLLGAVVVKLYVWDVWFLDRLYRITAFLGLGGLLLLASWVYARSSVSDRL